MAKARVYYKGFSDVREITAKQLEPLGISIDKDLVFHRGNSFAMNVDLNDELTKVLRNEGTFTISEIKDDSTIGDDIVTATLHDDTQVKADSLNESAGLVTARSGPTGAPPTPKP
jgi:hypothetical protein